MFNDRYQNYMKFHLIATVIGMLASIIIIIKNSLAGRWRNEDPSTLLAGLQNVMATVENSLANINK